MPPSTVYFIDKHTNLLLVWLPQIRATQIAGHPHKKRATLRHDQFMDVPILFASVRHVSPHHQRNFAPLHNNVSG